MVLIKSERSPSIPIATSVSDARDLQRWLQVCGLARACVAEEMVSITEPSPQGLVKQFSRLLCNEWCDLQANFLRN
jgi:hypothetical protein